MLQCMSPVWPKTDIERAHGPAVEDGLASAFMGSLQCDP
jgi:hypothetical protein